MAPLIDRDSPLLAEALSLWNAGEHERSLYLFDRAVKAEPDNLRVLINAARSHGKRFDLVRAGEILRKVAARPDATAEAHHLVGESYKLLARFAEAIEAFRRAAASPRPTRRCHVQLAALLEQAGDLDAAQRHAEMALRLEPGDPWATLVEAKVLARRGDAVGAEARFTGLGRRADIHDDLACEAMGELAQLLDRKGDFTGARRAIEACKARQLPHTAALARQAEVMRRRTSRMLDDLTPAVIASWRNNATAEPEPRVAHLAGFPRSGTTLLERVLDRHPGIASVEEKDILGQVVFHDLLVGTTPTAPLVDVLTAAPHAKRRRLAARYAALLNDWAGPGSPGKVLIDKNPGALLITPVLRRLVPSAPLIIALRDPRDVVLSCYMRYLKENLWSMDFMSPRQAAERYAFEIGGWLRLRDVLGGPFVEVRYEDMVRDLPGQARRVVQTLGLPWDEAVLDPAAAPNRIVASPTYADVAKPVYASSVGRWRAYAEMLAPAMDILGPLLATLGYGESPATSRVGLGSARGV